MISETDSIHFSGKKHHHRRMEQKTDKQTNKITGIHNPDCAQVETSSSEVARMQIRQNLHYFSIIYLTLYPQDYFWIGSEI